MTDTSPAAVERPCPNCGVTLDGHSGIRSYGHYRTHDTAYCLRYLRDQRDAANARADRTEAQLAGARDKALVEAATVAKDAISGACQKCGHPSDNHPYRHMFVGRSVGDIPAAILALRDKPAPVVTVDIDALAYRFWSIHPKDIPDPVGMPDGYKGGARAWMYATEIREAIRAIAGGGDE